MNTILEAVDREDGNGLKVWCVHCNKYHLHGHGEGHRIAHCDNPKSPYLKDGYELKVKNTDFIDKVINNDLPQKDLKLVGFYLEPELAKILDSLGKKGGRGTKSEIANLALRKLFKEKGLLDSFKQEQEDEIT